jgi:hypothetical protein
LSRRKKASGMFDILRSSDFAVQGRFELFFWRLFPSNEFDPFTTHATFDETPALSRGELIDSPQSPM